MFKEYFDIVFFTLIITDGINQQRIDAPREVRVPDVHLTNGWGIPAVGLGTNRIGGNPTQNDSAVARAIRDAIDVGYRHIDTAWVYNTERGIGMAVRDAIQSNQVTRQQLFITSKVWNTFQRQPKVVEAIMRSLDSLGLTYLDLALIHWPTGFREGTEDFPKYSNGSIIPRTYTRDSYMETWRGMEDAVRLGLTRFIGVSNFNARQLSNILRIAEFRPVVNQVENHPFLNQTNLLRFCSDNGIRVVAYAPLRTADNQLLNDPVLREIAIKHNRTAPQVALRWQLQRGVVVIPKSARKTRQLENIDIFDFEINNTDMRRIDGMETKPRRYDIQGIQNHPDYPFRDKY